MSYCYCISMDPPLYCRLNAKAYNKYVDIWLLLSSFN